MRITRHTFDVMYAQFNSTIESVTNVRPPTTTQSLSSTDLNISLARIFGLATNGNTTTDSASGVLTSFLSNILNGNLDENIYNDYLRSILTMPLLLFQPNSGLNLHATFRANSIASGLPSELYTTVDYANPVGRIIVSKWTILVYMTIAVSIYICCIAWLSWAMTLQKPRNSQFPLIDFAARALSKGSGDNTLAKVLVETTNGDDATIREKLWNKIVFLGDIDNAAMGEHADGDSNRREIGKIGFSTLNDVSPLKSGELYE
jgi:hypothetical protein